MGWVRSNASAVSPQAPYSTPFGSQGCEPALRPENPCEAVDPRSLVCVPCRPCFILLFVAKRPVLSAHRPTGAISGAGLIYGFIVCQPEHSFIISPRKVIDIHSFPPSAVPFLLLLPPCHSLAHPSLLLRHRPTFASIDTVVFDTYTPFSVYTIYHAP